jgi:hypothetical protein
LVDQSLPREKDGGIRYRINNSSDHEVSRVIWFVFPPESGNNPDSEEYRSLTKISGRMEPFPAGGFLVYKKSLQPRNYAIDFVGGNQPWYQLLSIEEQLNGKIIIKTKVTLNGNVLCEIAPHGSIPPCS